MGDQPYRSAFERVKDALPGNVHLRSKVVEDLEFPLRRNEAWRYTSARKLLSSEHEPTVGSVISLSDGVFPLIDALRHPAVHKLARVASREGFQALNLAFFNEGALVFVPADDVLKARVELRNTDGLTTPRLLVVVEEGGELELVVEHTLGSGLHVPVIEVFAGNEAKVSLTHIIRGTGGHAVCHVAIELGRRSEVDFQSIVLGGDIVRVELLSTGGKDAKLRTSGLVLARGRQHIDHHLHLHHDTSNFTSCQTFRNILDDRARAIFTGQVTINKDVHASNASQSIRTLLLADGASVINRPWLEIHNDDVVASHGASVGRLDPEALFYLRARGLPNDEARRILTTAFAWEIVQGIPESIQPSIREDVLAWLGT